MNKPMKITMWVALGLLFILAFGWITMSLWNWLVPDLFHGPVINFYQALGLLLLSKIIFGFGGKGGGHRGGMHWKQKYYRKMHGMTPEEREIFKAKIREKWCYRDQTSATDQQGHTNV